MKRLLLILVVLELVLFSVGFAQVKEFNFKRSPNLKKLSSHSITCMAQDSSGFIWIGTVDGLNRFNGYEVDVYRSHGKTSVGLTSNEITCVFVDSKNRIWVGTQFGISVFDHSHNVFIPLASTSDMGGLSNVFVTSIKEDKSARVLIAAGNSIYYLDEKTQKFKVYIESPVSLINAFEVDANNGVWYGLEDGSLNYFASEEGMLTRPEPLSLNEENRGAFRSIKDIAIRNNTLWIGYLGGGIVGYNLKSREIRRYLQGSNENNVVFIYLDYLNRLWSCDYTGLKLYDESSDSFYGYYHNPSELNSVRQNIEGVFLDKQGNYYFYYRGEGVYVSYLDRGFKQFDTSSQYYWHVTSANVMSVCDDSNGNLWLGGYNGGIDVFDWVKGCIKRFNNFKDDPIQLGIGTIFKIYRDGRGLMWIGSHTGGLRSYNTETGELNVFQYLPDNPESIIGNDVRAFSENSDGDFWVAIHGKGVDFFDRETGKFKHYNSERNGLASDWVETILYDSRDYLWVGSSSGLSMLSPGDSKFRSFFAKQGHPGSIQGNRVVCLHESRDGTIWIGTNDGLYQIDTDSYQFTRYGINAANQYICSIEEDCHGVIWFSTMAGLYRLDPLTDNVFQFSENDGLQGSGFNNRASYKNGQSELFFAGSKGINLFKQEDIQYNTIAPKIVFTRFLLFNKEVVDYTSGSILEKHISVTDEVTLNYDQKVFTIEFTALNMINPESNVYAFMMEGFDSDWNYVGTKREATYTNLNPGRYTFRVKAANNDGVWNEEGICLRIRILPPWYRTIWFYFLTIVFIISVVFFYYHWRTVSLRSQKKRLVSLVTEKTWKLREKNYVLKQRSIELSSINHLLEERQQVIEQQSEELEMQAHNLKKSNNELCKLNNTKDRLFSIIAHDLRTPFNTILGFSSLLIEDKNSCDKKLIGEHARYIHDASLQVFNLLENLLFWARSQTNEIEVNCAETDLDEITKVNLDLVRESLIKKELRLNTEKYSNFQVYVDVDMMRTVLRNLLINAVKFTPQGGCISVLSEKVGNFVKLSVSDTGVGISKEDIQLLTIAGEQKTTKGTDGERGSGLGLVLCNEFIIRNKGRLIIESDEGKGSIFSVLMPIKQVY